MLSRIGTRELVGDCLELFFCILVPLRRTGVAGDARFGQRTRRADRSGIGCHSLAHGFAGLFVLLAAPIAVGSAGEHQNEHDNANQRELLAMRLRLRDGATSDFLKLVFF